MLYILIKEKSLKDLIRFNNYRAKRNLSRFIKIDKEMDEKTYQRRHRWEQQVLNFHKIAIILAKTQTDTISAKCTSDLIDDLDVIVRLPDEIMEYMFDSYQSEAKLQLKNRQDKKFQPLDIRDYLITEELYGQLFAKRGLKDPRNDSMNQSQTNGTILNKFLTNTSTGSTQNISFPLTRLPQPVNPATVSLSGLTNESSEIIPKIISPVPKTDEVSLETNISNKIDDSNNSVLSSDLSINQKRQNTDFSIGNFLGLYDEPVKPKITLSESDQEELRAISRSMLKPDTSAPLMDPIRCKWVPPGEPICIKPKQPQTQLNESQISPSVIQPNGQGIPLNLTCSIEKNFNTIYTDPKKQLGSISFDLKSTI